MHIRFPQVPHSLFKIEQIISLAVAMILGLAIQASAQPNPFDAPRKTTAPDDPFGFSGDGLGPSDDPFTKSLDRLKNAQAAQNTKTQNQSISQIERINQQFKEDKQWLQNIDNQLSRKMDSRFVDELLQFAGRRVDELAKTSTKYERQVEDSYGKLEKARDELLYCKRELEEIKTKLRLVEDEIRKKDSARWNSNDSLKPVEEWFAAIIQNRDDRTIARSVMDMLERSPNAANSLTQESMAGLAGKAPRSLAAALLSVARGDFGSPIEAEQAMRILRRDFPKQCQELGLNQVATDPWPIVTQRSHTVQQDILSKLNQPTYARFYDSPLEEAFDVFNDFHRLPFVFDRISREKLESDTETVINIDSEDISLRSALNQILPQFSLGFYVEADHIKIVSADAARQHQVQRLYDVTEILDQSQIRDIDDLIAAISNSKQANEVNDKETLPIQITSIGNRLIINANEAQQHQIAVLLRLLASR